MAMLLVLVFLLLPPFFIFILLKHSNNSNSNRLPPGPPELPFIGNLHMLLFDSSVPHIFLWKLSRKYGPLMYLRFGFKSTLVVSSAKLAEKVMKTQDLNFCSTPQQRGTHKLSYNGLDLAFSPYNDYWREIRKLYVVHLFNRVQQYRPIWEDEVGLLIGKIFKLSVDSKPVNLSEVMMCFSSTIICRVGFDKRYDEGRIERSRYLGLLKESRAMLSSFSFFDYFSFASWVDRFTGLLCRLEKTFKQLDSFYQELIDEHLDPNRLKPEEEDIIDELLQLREDRDFPFNLNIDHIKAILMNVFVAGTEATAATVIWVMSFLMKYPKCLNKTQVEVRDLIGKKGFVNEDDVQGLTYLKAVIKETFILQPTAPLLVPRETLGKCNIGGYNVPAKTLVFVNAWAIGKNLETWENPEVFSPERFIGCSIDYKGLHYELVPFGVGRRICSGMRMGVATVELALANLLYNFDWEMAIGMNKEDLDFEAIPSITAHKKMLLPL
ncbi:hypothetical protein Goarm_009073 [Gossypium armourianum]|uniref:Cytochrome P450 n=1 Tax=Gossypium armourianum TaxID=34283 RepID=A0A7J9JRT0_9ROSI|nr:hypothetical protein [Gossypium armourianum]